MMLLLSSCATWLPPADDANPAERISRETLSVDVSHWTAEISDAEIRCLRDAGFDHLVAGSQDPRLTRQQLEWAVAGGMTVDVYVYLYWDQDMAGQVHEALDLAQELGAGRLWLDVEQDPAGRSVATLNALIDEAKAACGTFECGIYTGAWWWQPHLGNTTQHAELPLWYAWYDDDPTLDTWSWQAFGGWTWPDAKQYAESHVCGVSSDENVMVALGTPGPRVDPIDPGAAAPPAPSRLYPSGDVRIDTSQARLMVDEIAGATDYDLALEYFSGGTWRSYWTWPVSDGTQTVSLAYRNTVYRFRARATNAYGTGPWSDWARFEADTASEWPDDGTPGFCDGLMNGDWCDGDDLVTCSSDAEVARTTCPSGCLSMPVGTPDECAAADFCDGLMNGDWCDGDALVTCSAGWTVARETCANGCTSMPVGTPDECAAADFCDGLMNGDWCDGDDLVTCSGDVEVARGTCPSGCESMPLGVADRCFEFCDGLMNGWWCDGADLVYCTNDAETSRSTCPSGCQSMPLGTPDACYP